jgi:F-type H+-transporting ATPase subunit b
MPQLDPTWFASQIFWLVISFAALYFMLSRLILPPLLEIIARRAETLSSDIEMAQRLKSEAEQARVAYEKTMAEARSKAQSLMNDAVADQKAKAEAKGKELDRQIEQKLAAATAQIEAKKTQMLAELAPAAVELTAMIVEKLTNRAPKPEQVAQVLNELSKGRR